MLVHVVRQTNELAYDDYFVEHLPKHEFLGDMVTNQLLFYSTVTRQSFQNVGRISVLIETGKLMADLGLPDLDPAHDRAMICGSIRNAA